MRLASLLEGSQALPASYRDREKGSELSYRRVRRRRRRFTTDASGNVSTDSGYRRARRLADRVPRSFGQSFSPSQTKSAPDEAMPAVRFSPQFVSELFQHAFLRRLPGRPCCALHFRDEIGVRSSRQPACQGLKVPRNGRSGGALTPVRTPPRRNRCSGRSGIASMWLIRFQTSGSGFQRPISAQFRSLLIDGPDVVVVALQKVPGSLDRTPSLLQRSRSMSATPELKFGEG